jgi:hypothetical protein
MLLSGELHVTTLAMAASAIAWDERVLDLIRGKTQRQVEEILAARHATGVTWEFHFEAGPDFREKYERARALLSRKHPEGLTQEQVFDAALDEYLKRHDPARPVRVEHSLQGSERRTRWIPAAVQREVWQRDGGRCTFVGPQGHRCGSTWNVEIHHVAPYCRGGEHKAENLRLYCAAHNRRQAELDLGTAWMAAFSRRE